MANDSKKKIASILARLISSWETVFFVFCGWKRTCSEESAVKIWVWLRVTRDRSRSCLEEARALAFVAFWAGCRNRRCGGLAGVGRSSSSLCARNVYCSGDEIPSLPHLKIWFHVGPTDAEVRSHRFERQNAMCTGELGFHDERMTDFKWGY